MILEIAIVLVVILALVWAIGPCCCRPPRRISYEGKSILLVGASEGIGLALAMDVVKLGAKDIIIVSRSNEKLKKAKDQLSVPMDATKQTIWTFSCDATDRSAVSRLRSDIQETHVEIDHIFICQGAASPLGYFLQHPPSVFENLMQLNYMSVVYVLKAFLPGLYLNQRTEHRHVTVLSSMLAVCAWTGYSAYCPTKYALKGLLETLEQEFVSTGIHFHLSLPLDTETPGYEEENKTKPPETIALSGIAPCVSPEVSSDVILSTLRAGKFYVGKGFEYDACVTMTRGLGPIYVNPFINYLKILFFGMVLCCVNQSDRGKVSGLWTETKPKFDAFAAKPPSLLADGDPEEIFLEIEIVEEEGEEVDEIPL